MASRTVDRDSTAGCLPPPAERCIWMNAGLVTYKLCDRGFECETCPLDIAFRGPRPPAESERTNGRGPFPSDRRYHAGHTWARTMGNGNVRVGVDSFAAQMIGRARSAVLSPPGSMLSQGRAGCWLVVDEEAVPLVMPVGGTVVELNTWVRRHPGLVFESPYDDGWLLELSGAEMADEMAALVKSEEAARRATGDRDRFLRQAARTMREGRDGVGPTLNDGGLPAGDLRRLMGPKRYYQLLIELLR